MRPDWAGDADRDLGDLDRVGEASAEVVVVGSDEDLALACESPEGLRVMDAVEVALEAGAQAVGLLGRRPVAGAPGSGGSRRQHDLVVFLPSRAWTSDVARLADPRGGVRNVDDTRLGGARVQTVLLPRCSEYRGGVTCNGDR